MLSRVEALAQEAKKEPAGTRACLGQAVALLLPCRSGSWPEGQVQSCEVRPPREPGQVGALRLVEKLKKRKGRGGPGFNQPSHPSLDLSVPNRKHRPWVSKAVGSGCWGGLLKTPPTAGTVF